MTEKPESWNPPPGAREWFAAVVAEFVRGSTAEIERTPLADRLRPSSAIYVPMFVGTLSARFALPPELATSLLAVLRDRTPAEWAASVDRAERQRRADDELALGATAQLTDILDERARAEPSPVVEPPDNWCPLCRAPFVSMDPTRYLCRGHAQPTVGGGFVAGVLAVTPGAAAALDEAAIATLFRRHLSGDFGELDDEDVRTNQRAIASGDERVFSAYSVGDVELYVITEADRTRTTLLLRDEY